MIVVGVTPGIKSFSYVVLDDGEDGASCRVIDSDILRGGITEIPDEWDALLKRSNLHALVMSVVLERHSPAALAIYAEPSTEPAEHVEAASFVVATLAFVSRIPTVVFEDGVATIVFGDLSKSVPIQMGERLARKKPARPKRSVAQKLSCNTSLVRVDSDVELVFPRKRDMKSRITGGLPGSRSKTLSGAALAALAAVDIIRQEIS